MPYDYTDAPPPPPELIPLDTVVDLSIHIRPGGVGEDEMLKRNKDGTCEMLDCEFVVLSGQYKGRRFWNNFIINGTTDGQKSMAATHRLLLKAILDSAYGLDPSDVSAEARAARTVGIKAFQGMVFIGKIGQEKGGPNGKGGVYADKNVLDSVITKDKKDWHPVEQPPPFNGGGGGGGAAPPSAAPAAPVKRPGWAQT
jgi:hypothetical protein